MNRKKPIFPAGPMSKTPSATRQPASEAKNGWEINSFNNKDFPFATVIDLGRERTLASAWLYDTNGDGDTVFYSGKPGDW